MGISCSLLSFLLLVSFFYVLKGSGYFDPCPAAPLSSWGRNARARGEINVFAFVTATGRQPCTGLREDWREVLFCFFFFFNFFF